MTRKTMPEVDAEKAPAEVKPGSLKAHSWRRFLSGPDSAVLESLYVPALAEAIRYDRCCAYFSSTALAAAARGFGRLIGRLLEMGDKAPRPAVRLLVNEELVEEDVRAMVEAGDHTAIDARLKSRFKNPTDILEKKRLAMLGWLVKEGFLAIRVGVMRKGGGIVHAKFGIMTDEASDAVVFSGSGNESAQGLLANYERMEVSTSWEDPERYAVYKKEFEDLWANRHPDVHTLTLPEALRQRLVKYAPKEPPVNEPINALARQRAAMIWQFIVEAPYLEHGGAACDATSMVDLWPHQRHVVEETSDAWPSGRLLCDEVGMGKTIEAILVLRRLLAGRGVRRCLILLPAGLLRQWQAELREKGGLIFPRLEGTTALIWPDERVKKISGLEEALQEDVVLVSRETARTENNTQALLQAEPWDLVILDESHAARRKQQEEGNFNSGTLLLDLLRKLQLLRRTRGFLLLSATPMQTHPWEPWDLLSVLGEGGLWLAEFSHVRDFYDALSALKKGACKIDMAKQAARVIASDVSFPNLPIVEGCNREKIAQKLAFGKLSEKKEIIEWMGKGSPLARRMHRNTKATLRAYNQLGLLATPPARRNVDDITYDFESAAERRVYSMVSDYIEKRYAELEQEHAGKGFVMTVYRRRATSSWHALTRSLERRVDGLNRITGKKAVDPDLDQNEVPESLRDDDLPDESGSVKISASLPQDPQVAKHELREAERVLDALKSLKGIDTKRDHFFDVLKHVTDDGRSVLVFTEYADTMDYLRNSLLDHYGKALGCFSGSGGARWVGEKWVPVTKDAITRSLFKKEVSVLICTDAASEGLNLQAAGAIINYDLPWNPSKVEQRIGRIDRIGQMLPVVYIVNLFLKNSVDEAVYSALRQRCGLFEHFVGPMQPVLARAKKMLIGQEAVNAKLLEKAANEIDPLASEAYLESLARSCKGVTSPLDRTQLCDAFNCLTGEFGPKVKQDSKSGTMQLLGAHKKGIRYAYSTETLERDPTALPLTPTDSHLRHLADSLCKSGEIMPLVLKAHQRGAFRRAVAYWIDNKTIRIESFEQLKALIETWDGRMPDPSKWIAAEKKALKEAESDTLMSIRRAQRIEADAMIQQVEAARYRLLKELGRYLACVNPDDTDFNDILYKQTQRDTASAQRMKRCIEKFGKYPDWEQDLVLDLQAFARQLTENQRKARLMGREVDAALEDPRWKAQKVEPTL